MCRWRQARRTVEDCRGHGLPRRRVFTGCVRHQVALRLRKHVRTAAVVHANSTVGGPLIPCCTYPCSPTHLLRVPPRLAHAVQGARGEGHGVQHGQRAQLRVAQQVGVVHSLRGHDRHGGIGDMGGAVSQK